LGSFKNFTLEIAKKVKFLIKPSKEMVEEEKLEARGSAGGSLGC